MSYHTGSDIPNYWAYADNFVLHDRMFAATSSWSEPEHLFQISGWSAYCPSHRPLSCRNELANPAQDHKVNGKVVHPVFAWTDMTYLLKKHGVSWNYFVVKGTEPDCADDQALSCAPIEQDPDTPSIWNPLPNFDTVKANRQVRNVQSVENFYAKAKAGKLPAVSWLAPSLDVSEHSPGLVSSGQSYVTSVINAVMRSPNWSSTAILVKWDDWGGFYDHVVPPRADINGYGIRVPSLVISPYAKQGFVDHQTLSFDAYNKFIEDVFLGGERLDPKTDGRPDRRPNVREDDAMLGNLAKDFDFNQPPRPPMLLPVHPITTLK
jgi:phospholipase C